MSEFKVAVYQYQARDEPPARRLERLADAVAPLTGTVDLVVCPELFLSGYNSGDRIGAWSQPGNGPFADGVARIAKSAGLAVAYGFPEAADGARYNAAALVDATGELRAVHRKLRLPTDYERAWFSPGDRYTVVDLGRVRVALLICYDVEFPECVRASAAAGAELIVVPTALTVDWAVVTERLVPTRAFENNVFVAYANYAGAENGLAYLGASCIVAPDGRDLARAGPDETVIVAGLDLALVERTRRRLPYLDGSRGLRDLPAG